MHSWPHFDLPWPPPANLVKLSWSKMACTGVPHIVLHVLCSTRTSGGYYEPSEIRFEGILALYLYKRNRPKGPKIPLNLTSEGLKYPPEVRVEHKTCSTICGSPVPAILNHRNSTGSAGGASEEDFHMRALWFPFSFFFRMKLKRWTMRSCWRSPLWCFKNYQVELCVIWCFFLFAWIHWRSSVGYFRF